MSARTFVDTNVWVKLFDDSDPARHRLAHLRITEEERSGVPMLSPAILGEVYSALTKHRTTDGRAVPPILNRDEAAAAVRALARFDVRPVTVDAVLNAVERVRSREVPKIWDAVHVMTAASHGCTRFLTWDTDLQDGATLCGVVIEHVGVAQRKA